MATYLVGEVVCAECSLYDAQTARVNFVKSYIDVNLRGQYGDPQ